jgi:mono/diheme cytochrome c family protein
MELRVICYIAKARAGCAFDKGQEMTSLIRFSLTIAVVVVIPVSAFSQQIGDARRGLEVASAICSKCHAITQYQPASPNARAPRFEDVANSSGMTAIALTAWLQTSHPTMPNIKLTDAETRDVIQYILSLKSTAPKP